MPAPHHIVYLLHSLGRGGTENGVVNLLNRMDHDRFHFTVALIKREREMLSRVERDGVDVVSVGRRWGNDPLFPLKLMQLFRRRKPDLVHTRGFSCIEGVPAARIAGVKAVLHSEHGREVDEVIRMKGRRAALRSVLYPMADAVVTVSDELGDWLASQVRVARSKMVCVPNGVEIDRFVGMPSKLAARQRLGLPHDARIIGSVGRHDPVKDYASLLRAFARLYDKHADLHLYLVGDGPQNETLRAAATELQVEQRVHFGGWTDDLPVALSAIDVFVLPSVSEGMSNALLEAMAAGLPCVATDVGGNPEVLEHGKTGLLVPSRDPDQMAAALERLAEDDALALRFGTAGRLRASTRFSLPAMVARYEDLYLGLIEKGNRSASDARSTRRAAAPASQDVAASTLRDR